MSSLEIADFLIDEDNEDEFAEHGVAAHWGYKEGGRHDDIYREKIAWLRQILEWKDEESNTNLLL